MKSKTYIASVLAIFFGLSQSLNGQEFFETYSEIKNGLSHWIKIQRIRETPSMGYEVFSFTVTDVLNASDINWLEVNADGELLNAIDLDPPSDGFYDFWNTQLLNKEEYIRSSLKWFVDSLFFTKFTANNEIIWEKIFPNVDHNGFLTDGPFEDIWLLYKANSVDGDSLVLNKMTNNGELIWQSKFPGDFDLNAYSPLEYKINFATTPSGGIIFQNRKYSEQYWGILSVNSAGQLKWVYDTLPGIVISLLAVGADESTLLLFQDTSSQESLTKLNAEGQVDWNILLADSTGWASPVILGAVSRKGEDFVLVATVSDTLKAVHIRPDGSFGQRWEHIDSGAEYIFHTGMEDDEGNILFSGLQGFNGFLAKISPLESFPSTALTAVKQPFALHVFPNPATDKITVSLSHPLERADYKIILMNTLGEAVLSQYLLEGNTEIAVDAVPPGVYYLTVFQDGAVFAAERLLIHP